MDELPDEAGVVDFFSGLDAEGADLSEPEDDEADDEDSLDDLTAELSDDLPDEPPAASLFAAARESVR